MAAVAAAQAILPIAELSSYQSRWVIKARVTNKVPLRTFSRKVGGEGKVFSVDLLDAEGSDIRASFFNDAADKYVNILQAGSCYTFSSGSVRVANKQYNQTGHRYELSFDRDAQVIPCEEDKDIKAVKFNFVDLRVLQSKALPCRVDLCGVVTSVKAPTTVRSKDRELLKREIVVADDTATSIEIALWGSLAQIDDAKLAGNPVVAFKNVLVKEWNGGRGGSALDSNALVFEPVGPEAERVKRWWAQQGASAEIKALSVQGGAGGMSARARDAPFASLTELRSLAQQVGEDPILINTVCRLAIVTTRKQGEHQPLYYAACAEPKTNNGLPCNRRLDASGFCASCNRAGKSHVRLNIRGRYSDFGDSLWLTTFHEGAQQVLAASGEEIQKVDTADNENHEHVEALVKRQYFAQPLQLTVRAKLDAYNGDVRPNMSCIDARPLNRREHGRTLLKQVQDMLAAGEAL